MPSSAARWRCWTSRTPQLAQRVGSGTSQRRARVSLDDLPVVSGGAPCGRRSRVSGGIRTDLLGGEVGRRDQAVKASGELGVDHWRLLDRFADGVLSASEVERSLCLRDLWVVGSVMTDEDVVTLS